MVFNLVSDCVNSTSNDFGIFNLLTREILDLTVIFDVSFNITNG